MPEPILDDTRCFDEAMYESGEEDYDHEFENDLGSPGNIKLKRSLSNSSINSQLSRGSSQFWEGMLTPDETVLCGIDDTRATLFDHAEERQSKWRADVPSVSDQASVNHPSSPDNTVATERSLSELDEASVSEKAARRLKPDTDTSPSRRKVSDGRFIQSEDSGIFLPNQDAVMDNQPPIVVVAHSDHHKKYFDRLSWGVLWEIARLVSSRKLQFDDILIDDLRALEGPNAIAAPLVEQLLLPRKRDGRYRQTYEEAFAKEISTKSPWAELDKEEESLSRDPLSGLGCNSLHDDWYGGKVSFTAKLHQREQIAKREPQYYLELSTPELGASTRFMRRWGSRRFLRVRIPDATIRQPNNHLIAYFEHDFVIHGRVFRPFYAKDHSVFLFELNSVYAHGHVLPDPRDGRVSFDQFLHWHNPMMLNKNQSLAKWCARMAIGLSNSAPGVEIAPGNYTEMDDIHSPAGQAALDIGRKPESKDIMTDGTGYTNQATLVATKYKFNWDLVPSAIQFRLGGAKGLLLLHPNDNGAADEPFRVWIRSSQRKIKYDQSLARDRAHLVLDVLRRSQLKHPARLSTEIIVNLAHNGVSYRVFEGLMSDGLQDIAASLTQWSGRYAMQNLWAAVARVNGSIVRSRMAREAGGSSRVLGFGSRDRDDEEEEEAEEEGLVLGQARSTAYWADEISGCPSTIEESVMVLLDAGFEPQSCGILAKNLMEVFKKALTSYIERYKIVVPRSAEAWIVPDPCGVLEAGEIFLKTSEGIIGQDGLSCDHLSGDVLVTRHPCCVPSDVQKVRAVWRDELRKYCDVIVFSIRGERSLASMLGGGDYDGDTVHVIWEPSIVNAFRKPDDKFADPPPSLDEAFERDTMSVDEFLANRQEQYNNDNAMVRDLQPYLLAALKEPSLVGQYSIWHDTAVYQLGYENDEAWRLAYMFCAVLDSSKSGKTVRPEILKQDSRAYKGRRPSWKDTLLEFSSNPPPTAEPPQRLGKLAQITFIMDHLKKEGKKKYDYHMAKFEEFLSSARQQYKAHRGIMSAGLYVDPVLEAPWETAMKRAERLFKLDGNDRMMGELDRIRNHVQAVRERHREIFGQDPSRKGRNGRSLTSPGKDKPLFTDMPIERRQNLLRELSLLFNQMQKEDGFMILSPADVRRCSASYAYILETTYQEKRFADAHSRFPFNVAMRELCIIKAESVGSCKMVASSFYSAFNVTGAIKAFRSADCPAYSYLP